MKKVPSTIEEKEYPFLKQLAAFLLELFLTCLFCFLMAFLLDLFADDKLNETFLLVGYMVLSLQFGIFEFGIFACLGKDKTTFWGGLKRFLIVESIYFIIALPMLLAFSKSFTYPLESQIFLCSFLAISPFFLLGLFWD